MYSVVPSADISVLINAISTKVFSTVAIAKHAGWPPLGLAQLPGFTIL